MKNKKGSTILIILIALVYFIFGMIFMNFIKDDVTIARDATHLKCSNPDTDGDKLTCLIVDGVIPLFIIAVLSAGGGYITDKALK